MNRRFFRKDSKAAASMLLLAFFLHSVACTEAIAMSDPAAVLGPLVKKQISPAEFVIERVRIAEACRVLRDAGWEHLSCITGVDWENAWEVLYHIARYGTKDVVLLRVKLPYQDPSIPSVTSVWPGAGWHERETYDLLGIRFEGNKDLRRILLPYDYEEHPLRKEVLFGNRS